MGDDGTAFALNFRVHENSTDRSQFLTVVTAYNTGFAEKRVHSGVIGGQGTCVRRGGTASGCGAAALDGRNVAAFVDKAAAMLEQPLRIIDFFHVKHDDAAGFDRIKCVVQVFQHILNA